VCYSTANDATNTPIYVFERNHGKCSAFFIIQNNFGFIVKRKRTVYVLLKKKTRTDYVTLLPNQKIQKSGKKMQNDCFEDEAPTTPRTA